MPSTICPHCNATVGPYDPACKDCGKGLSGKALLAENRTQPASATSTPESQTVPIRALSHAQTVSRVVWGIALLFMVISAGDGFLSISIQTGAPQQAAAGAIACFHVIAPYVIARAFHQMLCAK